MQNDKIIKILELNNFKYIFSSPKSKTCAKKLIYRKIVENSTFWQEEKYKDSQVFHNNISENEIRQQLLNAFENYTQCCVQNESETLNVFNFNEKIVIKHSQNVTNYKMTHNKQKKYIINEGDHLPALVDLGVFTKEYKIINAKYDKFKQINKFIEIIDDFLSKYNKKTIKIIDFGCGKSYLTFVLYYYLTEIKKINAHINGYDLKVDVVKNCNELATKYNYTNLHFFNEDVAKVKCENDIDMLITLHACDTATDYALNFAIKNKVKYIFSVPCCQHEINLSIQKGGDFDSLLSYGIIKERFSALLTDTIRAKVLEANGYKVDILEFVDFAHTPKNLMIRAKKTNSNKKDLSEIEYLKSKYNFKQKLLDLQ